MGHTRPTCSLALRRAPSTSRSRSCVRHGQGRRAWPSPGHAVVAGTSSTTGTLSPQWSASTEVRTVLRPRSSRPGASRISSASKGAPLASKVDSASDLASYPEPRSNSSRACPTTASPPTTMIVAAGKTASAATLPFQTSIMFLHRVKVCCGRTGPLPIRRVAHYRFLEGLDARKIDETQLERTHDRLGAIRCFELGDYVLDVVLHGTYAYHKLLGYFPIGLSERDVFQYLELARRQRVRGPGAPRFGARGRRASGVVGQPLEQPCGEPAIQGGLAFEHLAYGGYEFLLRGILQHVARRTGFYGLQKVVLIFVHGEY